MSTPTLPRPVAVPGPESGVPAGSTGRSGVVPSAENRPTAIGPSFLAAAAILAGSSALGAAVSGRSWVLPLIEVVAVIWLVGVGGRLIRFPSAVTVVLQLAGFAVALTSLFTSTGIGGVLPNPAALSEAGGLLSGAWAQIVGTAAPAPSTPELSFLIALAVGCAELVADFLVAEAGAPALVALPLLCLYSVPASIATHMLPWYTFVGPAVLYTALLAVTGPRGLRTTGAAKAGVTINGASITALATVTALLAASVATGIGTTGRLPHTSAGGGGAVGLSPLASLRGSLQQSNPVTVLTASGLPGPDYFRTVALTTYTPNQGWTLGPLESDLTGITGPLDGPLLPSDAHVTVNPAGYQDRFLPILSGTSAVTGLAGSWDFDSSLDTVFRTDKIRPGSYVLSVAAHKPTVAELEDDSVAAGGELTETGSLAASVRATAQQVTKAQSGAFDKALALQQWFTDPANGFVYSLKVPSGSSGDALVDFLANKQGFCEQYAAAMAVMLRSLNIPSRVVVGFTQGQKQANGSYVVTSNDAHAWVEVDFEQNGWVRFDPTPPVDGQGGEQGFQTPAGRSTTTPTASASPTVNSRSNAVPGDQVTASARSSAVATQVQVASGSRGPGGTWADRILVVLAVLAVLALALLVPTAVRLRRRGRRLATARSGSAGAAAAAWAEIEDTAIDHGIGQQPNESARVSANRLARRAHLEPEDRSRLRGIVMAAERSWYGTTSDAGAGVLQGVVGGERSAEFFGADVAAGVVGVVSGLREHAPIRLLDRIVPRSLRPCR